MHICICLFPCSVHRKDLKSPKSTEHTEHPGFGFYILPSTYRNKEGFLQEKCDSRCRAEKGQDARDYFVAENKEVLKE
jgi:hypothetical protein